MRFPDAEILVMARAPVAGEAKTRLIPALGEEGAAQLHAFLVERLLLELTQADVASVTLCCTPDAKHPFFQECKAKYGVKLMVQRGYDLGERLQHALSSTLEHRQAAVIIGCDIPLLNSSVVTSALRALENGDEAVISPTEDGGYALLGLHQTDTSLFEGVAWGTGQVMSQTRCRLNRLGWRCSELDTLWDVDRPEDLPRLRGLLLPPWLETRIIR